MAARIWCLSALLSVFPLADAAAGTVVDASPPVETRVTIYRAKGDDTSLAVGSNLDGYALISETREVDVPAGSATIRFPGVAAGMLAESAVVTGLPVGVREKNLDAALLSPGRLYGGWYGRPVMVRRHDPKTGRLREERAVVRSAPGGAAVVETASGFEVLNCGPFKDSLAYPGVPQGLSSSPTLSVATDAPSGAHARVTLSYLAWNFDWRADYVLDLEADRRHAMLNAWVTLASGDVTSFVGAQTSVVAGNPDFDEKRAHGDEEDGGTFMFRCFPASAPPSPIVAPPPPIVGQAFPAPEADLVVTAMRRVVAAKMEDLGDLKLYRLPLPTTVAARGQKQVALFAPRRIVVEQVLTADLGSDDDDNKPDVGMVVRLRNRKENGLGLALPKGAVRVFARQNGAELLLGQGQITDRAVNERADITYGTSPQVTAHEIAVHRRKGAREMAVTVSNANPVPVSFEGVFANVVPGAVRDATAPLALRDGRRIWITTIPAHGKKALRYRLMP
ncbi:DUF4139 domain-containing protein [Novosphingobium nitrogenifigens]|uniref:DUF4139 domain-containing protein n=1 Tax=Novosphingobium nitrogenifigens TaxID=378548 RepID=UPI00037BB511|nr:hypothetical protein [Novosphingobium nitrogenifigens]